jgi:hypothetical protein
MGRFFVFALLSRPGVEQFADPEGGSKAVAERPPSDGRARRPKI